METVLTGDPLTAAEFIRSGQLCAFPTETVYGLGADVFDAAAVAKIFEAKQRPADNPLIAHIGYLEQIASLSKSISADAQKLIDAFFPGPLTVVVLKSELVPPVATAGLETIGIRMPRNDLAKVFLSACGSPVAAPSANLSGRPSPTTWQAVYEDLSGRIGCILQGNDTKIGLESTVVDCTGEFPMVLRHGAVSLQQVQAVVPGARFSAFDESASPKSPGMKHRHYSPTARVVLISGTSEHVGPSESAYIGITEPGFEPVLKLIAADAEDYAHWLFEFFRECDRRGIEKIYCEEVSEEGIGAALMDRLRRAAQG